MGEGGGGVVKAGVGPGRLFPFRRLAALSFFHALAPGLWMMSLGNVLQARGWGQMVPLAFALGPAAAMISPLWVGNLADRKVEAQKLLGWLCAGSAVFLWAAFHGMEAGLGPGWFLLFHGLHALCFTPTWSLVASIVFAHIPEPERHFPLLRVWATLSWVAAGIWISLVMKADASPLGGMAAAVVLAGVAVFTRFLPRTPPRASGMAGRRGWRAALGLDALVIFRTGDFKAFLVATGLLALPMAAYFPFAPQMLRELGQPNPTAWMSLGQVAESLSMLALGWLVARWRIKRVMTMGLCFVVLRYVLMSAGAWTGCLWLVYPALAMHGLIFTLYFVTSQIFLELRVEPMMRSRAQALLTTVSGGIGSLAGTLGCGWWHRSCMGLAWPPGARWLLFWGALAVLAALVLGYFTRNYKGRTAV